MDDYKNLTTTMYPSNTTEDIVNAGCFVDPFSIIACTRYAVMSLVILVTGIICIYRIYQLHSVKHEALHHYFIFYMSTICCILCIVHWVLGEYAQLDFIAQWFKQLTYLVVTHFFWTRAHRALRRQKLTNFCLLPGMLIGLLYCTAIVIVGIVSADSDYKSACLSIEWVLMSSAELFIAQMFLLAGFFISKRLDSISTIQSVRRSQKCKLWSLVTIFEFSAIVGFTYDLTMLAVGSKYDNCGRIFHFNQLVYSFTFGTFMIIKFPLPMWAMLAALEPIPAVHITEDDDTDSLQSSDQAPILVDRRILYIPRLLQSLRRSTTTTSPTDPPTPVTPESPNGVTITSTAITS